MKYFFLARFQYALKSITGRSTTSGPEKTPYLQAPYLLGTGILVVGRVVGAAVSS